MEALLPGLQERLNVLRARRGFSVSRWVDAKIELLNAYVRDSHLSAAVVGVSGGIDSAIVLSLAKRASERPGSHLKRVIGVCLPYMKLKEGTTNQSQATTRGKATIESIGAEMMVVDLTETHKTLKTAMDKEAGVKNAKDEAWASGQLVSYLRTPALYYATAQLFQGGFPAILLGTTNRDEGAYIGYFGKAADAMNDVQLISDLHKSEVYQVARYLGDIPEEVISAVPTGDIYDGRTDEQLIGVPYDFIELHALSITIAHPDEASRDFDDEKEREQWERMHRRIEQLHQENKHKYLGGSVALHFDVWPRPVLGGWRSQNEESDPPQVPNSSHFVNLVPLDPNILSTVESNSTNHFFDAEERNTVTRHDLPGMGDSALQVHSLLSKTECKLLRDWSNSLSWTPAGIDGMRIPKGRNSSDDHFPSTIGSYRLSFYSLSFANALWRRISPIIDIVRHFDEYSSTDFDRHSLWRAVGVSPLFRAIKYEQGGYLVPHYDSSYCYSTSTKTLMSVIIYLTEGEGAEDGSGKTRFILDPQRYLPQHERVYKDSTTTPSPKEIILSVDGFTGSALIFDHRILHDSDVLKVPDCKIILRTDIVFEQCGLASNNALYASKPLGMPDKPGKQQSLRSKTARLPLATMAPELAGDRLYRKHLKDPYYSSVMAMTGSFDCVIEAGFFDDGAPEPEEVGEGETWKPQWEMAPLNWLSTPLSKIEQRLEIYNAQQRQRDAHRDHSKTKQHSEQKSNGQIESPRAQSSLSPASSSSISSPKSKKHSSKSKNTNHTTIQEKKTKSSGFASPIGQCRSKRDAEDQDPWLAVLLSTGSFNPIHNGHLDMMEQGKLAVEANGGFVLGGYLSPSHDAYVGSKLRDEALSARHRLWLCELATQDSDWIMADGWEALEVKYPVNFTDVIIHLEQYISAHIPTHKPIHIVYIFGSDHTRFSLTFVERGKAVCLKRPGYDKKLESYLELDFFDSIAKNVIFWETPTLCMSSTEARKGEKHGLLPSRLHPVYADLVSRLSDRKTSKESNSTAENRKITYYIRDEGEWNYQFFLSSAKRKLSSSDSKRDKSVESSHESTNEQGEPHPLDAIFKEAWEKFRNDFTTAIAEAHSTAQLPDIRREVEFKIMHLSDQRKQLEDIVARAHAKGFGVISLDPCLLLPLTSDASKSEEKASSSKSKDTSSSHSSIQDASLEFSRWFALAVGSQFAPLKNRPGSPPLVEQIMRLPSGKFVLFDDDSWSGFTFERTKQLIAEHRGTEVTIVGCVALTSSPDMLALKHIDGGSEKQKKSKGSPKTPPSTPTEPNAAPAAPSDREMIDARDFLMGSYRGGLVVGLADGQPGRAPYVLPYVSPAQRASIPISVEARFSLALWKANIEFFKSLPVVLTVSDMDSRAQEMLKTVGFHIDTPCTQVAKWHVERLEALAADGSKKNRSWWV